MPLREGRLFSRYLVGKVAADPILQRYARAVKELFGGEAESPALRFAKRHRWALPLLDAACGLARPDDALRRRLLVMAAVLETTPEHAEAFLPRPVPRGRLIAGLAVSATAAALKAILGLPLLFLLAPGRGAKPISAP